MVKLDTTFVIPQRSEQESRLFDSPLRLTKSFYKKPKNSLILLLAVVLLVEFIAWVVIPEVKRNTYLQYHTFFNYLKNFIIGFIAPELCTLTILVYMINFLHKKLKFNTLRLKPLEILRYELAFLPLFLVAFFFFFPITLNVRYILREFPDYTFTRYSLYIFHSFTWNTYFLYLPFVLILGYGLINLSLVKDFIDVSKHIATADSYPTNAPSLAKDIAQYNTSLENNSVEGNYLQSIMVKDHKGDVVLNVEECYYFETLGKSINVYHANGVYRKIQPLSCLAEEIDPNSFFRVSRQQILNLRYVKSFTYWEKGKYIIYLNTPAQVALSCHVHRCRVLKKL
ncbi:MAG: LytTR family DNA-binding domain-containing protein [Spirosomataceae bacterium]